MAGRRDGEHLVAVVRELSGELGYAPGPDDSMESELAASSGLWETLGATKDGLVAELRRGLARLAEASLQGGGEDSQTVRVALDGAEMVIRSEVAAQRWEALDEQLPAIVFVVVLPGLGRERALQVSRRAAELLGSGPAAA